LHSVLDASGFLAPAYNLFSHAYFMPSSQTQDWPDFAPDKNNLK